MYPTTAAAEGKVEDISYTGKGEKRTRGKGPKPKGIKVFIPVFPGTNCEIDTAKKFEEAGAEPVVFVIKNRSPKDVEESVKAMAKAISACKILAIPGGFSGGDEPDGSAKLIAAFFSNARIAEEVEKMLYKRDGLALGICNGFQALVKLGLLPYGHISTPKATDPVLTFNNIGRHVSTLVDIRVATGISPWLSGVKVGDVFKVPVSHGEGKFVAKEDVLKTLVEKGQIATQYCDEFGHATMASPYNPNGSMLAIEGIVSPDGRVLGKMGHSERIGEFMMKNAVGSYAETDMHIFKSGVDYYK